MGCRGFAFDVENPTAEQMQGIDRTVAVFERGAPALFVSGLGIPNPRVEQTIRAYRAYRANGVAVGAGNSLQK